MDPKKFAWFLITSTLLLTSIDVYVLYAWQKFIRSRGWNKWSSRIPWIIGLAMAISAPFVSFVRSNQAQLNDWFYALYIFFVVWYVSKIPIMLFLMIKDLARFLRWLIMTVFTRRSAKTTTETISSRRAMLQASAWSAAAIPFIVVGRGIDNTDNFNVARETIELPKLSSAFDGFTIAQISDLHAGSWRDSRAIQEARRLIDLEKPSILLITGDFVNFHPEELKIIRTELEKLHAELGVFASLGNHDHYMKAPDHALLQSVIRNTGMKLLVNENHIFKIDNETLQLAAIDNTGLGQSFGDLSLSLVGTHEVFPTVLMAHDPTFWDKEVRSKTNVDLMLSGHTHGGQVGMKILGHEYSIAQLVYKQWAGVYQDGDQYLYVNRGLGTIGPPMRIGVPPEITIFTLKQRKALLG